MIFNKIKCHVNTSLGLVGGMHPPLYPRLITLCYSVYMRKSSEKYAYRIKQNVFSQFDFLI